MDLAFAAVTALATLIVGIRSNAVAHRKSGDGAAHLDNLAGKLVARDHGVLAQVLLEPVTGREVEVVRGLVEQQDVVALQDELEQREPCAFAPAERAHRLFDHLAEELEGPEHAAHVALGHRRVELVDLAEDRVGVVADLEAEALGIETLILVAHPDHSLVKEPKVQTKDLKGETLLFSKVDCSYRRTAEAAFNMEKIRYDNTLEFNSVEAIKQCVMAGV